MPVPFRAKNLVFPLLSLSLALGACGAQDKNKAPPVVDVGVVTLATQPVTIETQLTGRTAATTTADVRPQVDGIIKNRLFAEGSMVKAGQPLYQIDARLYRASVNSAGAQLESAQATLANAEAKAKRYQSLSDPTAVSRQDLDDTLAAARTARANVHLYAATLATARVNMGFTQVYAPISGRIGRSSVTKGALVSAAQTTALATIQQLDPIYVDITQSSTDLLRLRMALAKKDVLPTQAQVKLQLEDGTAYPLPGTVEFSEVNVDATTGSVTLRARFPNPQNLLLPGMFVKVITPQGTLPNGILAPQQGITRDARGNATALVVNGQNKVELRNVTVAQAVGHSWLVTKGLKAGDRLIVEGTDKAQEGASVHPVAVKVEG
ncbi:efflux RND transporter periplasmic adaptor subunit [Novosphingobium sediminicola]|uniref:Membrane fusion protein (Multidrug efflux system) n=1 Tax=Novosphingobium sediminicola TaxID=563162 RepID=A0A7W6G4U3_9SPHN|nr:membrane fusion protein (multidrug efflux system) [Novosphingobium sediminicola]